MITFLDSKEKSKETDKCLDSQLWHACAGSMVQMPPVDSTIFYFPQGHAEHASEFVDFRKCPRIPSYIPCRVTAIKFMADPETDEVYSKINLIPVNSNYSNFDDDSIGRVTDQEKPSSFAKTLTQSDANNGGGFSVPRYCAETIFPRLDYSSDPPVQTILAKDVHGEIWKFRHIYRGTPRRHLLTTGWSSFVNHKKLVAGDSIVFLRAENGDLCVGIRRAKRGVENPTAYENRLIMRNGNFRGKVGPESVIEAVNLASSGRGFEVVYYPRASTPEFCVKAALVKAALQVRWSSGMRFKMPFETEDSSRISWFMGTISSVQVTDPIRWPDSPWRLLQVTWDEPDLLQNVKHVSPWLVELVSAMPPLHLSPFSPPRKKLRSQNPDFPIFDNQFPITTFSTNPYNCIPENAPGMQGARHPQFNLPLPDFHFNNKLHSTLFATTFPQFNHPIPQKTSEKSEKSENLSCLLTMGSSTQNSNKRTSTQFVLFGQPILTEQQILLSCSGNSSSKGKKSSSEEIDLETGHCKVFLESDDVGRTLDLSILGSYDELYMKLANMFGIENSEIMNHVLYRDGNGSMKQIGNEPFSDFTKTAKRLTILMELGNDNVGV